MPPKPPKRNGPAPKPLADRIHAAVLVDDNGCWLWQRSIKSNGYGQMGVPGAGMRYAHRISYQTFRGPIPDGLQIDHLCRVRRCVNPDHLEAVTCRENLIRGVGFVARHVAATHCPAGHPYDECNTRIGTKGERMCKRCRNDRKSRWRRQRREEAA